MGLGKFVGIDLCPRLKSFRDRRLHIPRRGRVKVPDVLKPVCLADVSLPAIIEGWPDMSAIANAVAGGRLSAVLACERHGTAARGQKGYRAGMNWDFGLRESARTWTGSPHLRADCPSASRAHLGDLDPRGGYSIHCTLAVEFIALAPSPTNPMAIPTVRAAVGSPEQVLEILLFVDRDDK
jgi:hypothetical protein